MRPIDFVIFDGGSNPNLQAYKLSKAMVSEIKIRGQNCEYNLLSYYEENGVMVIDIEAIL